MQRKYSLCIMVSMCLILYILTNDNFMSYRCNHETLTVPVGFTYKSPVTEKNDTVSVIWLDAYLWKFSAGGFIILEDSAVILPTSDISLITQGYSWYRNEKEMTISTNDKSLISAILKKNIDKG